MKLSLTIKDVQFIIDQNRKSMLIYLELNKLGTWFLQKSLEEKTQAMLSEALPNYRFRVIYDLDLFNKALNLIQKA